MRVALRCDRHKHGVIDLQESILEIKCQHCSRIEGRPVFHHWRWTDGTVKGADWEGHEDHRDSSGNDHRSRR